MSMFSEPLMRGDYEDEIENLRERIDDLEIEEMKIYDEYGYDYAGDDLGEIEAELEDLRDRLDEYETAQAADDADFIRGFIADTYTW